MDYSMPDENGPAVAQEIFEYIETQPAKSGQRPYVCCFSAYLDRRFEEQALAAGMD